MGEGGEERGKSVGDCTGSCVKVGDLSLEAVDTDVADWGQASGLYREESSIVGVALRTGDDVGGSTDLDHVTNLVIVSSSSDLEAECSSGEDHREGDESAIGDPVACWDVVSR